MTAIVFDLDGTLIDSASDLQAAANAMLAGLGRPPLDRETVIGFIGRGVDVLVRRVLVHAGLDAEGPAFEAALAAFHQAYAAEPLGQTRPYPGVPDLLETLAARGHALGLCTNKPERPARAICAALGLADRFDAVVGGDTLDVKKPDPAPLLRTLALLGASPEDALYVGDSETDYLTARAANVPFVFAEGGYQRGPIADFRPDHRLARLPDLVALPCLCTDG